MVKVEARWRELLSRQPQYPGVHRKTTVGGCTQVPGTQKYPSGPYPRRPEVAGGGNFGLLVDWQLRRGNRNTNANNLCRGGSRRGQHNESDEKGEVRAPALRSWERGTSGRWHVHCAIELPSHLRAIALEKLIRACWTKVELGYGRIFVRDRANAGWIDYMQGHTKVGVRRPS